MKKILLLLHLLTAAFFATAQNVGIGTTTPVQKLHVEGTTYLNGNVGIGASTPAFPLSFGTALGDKISLWSNSSNSYGFGIQGGLLQIHTDISAADIAFGYGSSAAFTEKMRIKGDGNVGIGLTSPSASIDVARGTGAGGTAVFRGTTHVSHFNYNTDEDTYIRAGKDNRYVIINDIPGGKVGIGTSSPTEKLQVAGNIKADTVKPAALKLTPNAGVGKVLTSDATGNANWQTSSTGGGVGFGSWGDCSMNGISEYNPIAEVNGVTGNEFGHIVSISGNYAIVGVPNDNGVQGSASIYQYNGSNWVFMQKITDATGAAGDAFGNSVSISGNYAIVGANWDDVGANPDQGSSSIYQYNGSSWILMQKITDATGATSDFFGISVSISGNYAIVGASGDDVGANADQGSASFYQFNGSSWVLMQKITDATGTAGDAFGYSVSISGNYAIVGAYHDDVGANADQGSASIYQYNGSSWVLMQKITDAGGAANYYFGNSVSISGSYAIVGAYGEIVGKGSASFYQYNGSSWVLMQKIINASGVTLDVFGYSVTISGNYAIVGAPGVDVGANNGQGAASIYLRVGLAWQKLQYVTDPGGNDSDLFGNATAVDGVNQRFLIGVPGYAGSSGKVVFGKVN